MFIYALTTDEVEISNESDSFSKVSCKIFQIFVYIFI